MSSEMVMMEMVMKGMLSELTDEQRAGYDALMAKFNEFFDVVKEGAANEDPVAVIALTAAGVELGKVAEAL